MNALRRNRKPAPESLDDTLFSLREKLTQTQPTSIRLTVSILRVAACAMRDAELKLAVADVDATESSDPQFMDKYCDLLVCASDTFCFLEMQAQVIAAEIERHQAALGIEEKLTLQPLVLPCGERQHRDELAILAAQTVDVCIDVYSALGLPEPEPAPPLERKPVTSVGIDGQAKVGSHGE